MFEIKYRNTFSGWNTIKVNNFDKVIQHHADLKNNEEIIQIKIKKMENI